MQTIVSWGPAAAPSITMFSMLSTDGIQVFVAFITALLLSRDPAVHHDRHTILKITPNGDASKGRRSGVYFCVPIMNFGASSMVLLCAMWWHYVAKWRSMTSAHVTSFSTIAKKLALL
jgi:hypothetical protein